MSKLERNTSGPITIDSSVGKFDTCDDAWEGHAEGKTNSTRWQSHQELRTVPA